MHLKWLIPAVGLLLCPWAQGMPVIADGDITHTAVGSGAWFDPATWDNGIPGDDAWVLIPAGRTVTYGGDGPAMLHAVRVDGVLTFTPDVASTLRLDTLLVEHAGELIIGTADAPITGSVDLLIDSSADIDVGWDPTLTSRGVIVRGAVTIHGAPKATHLKVQTDPLAGESQLVLAAAPLNWQAGDTIVLTGTRYSGWKWDNDIRAVRYHGTQDEVRTIAAIAGNVVTLDQPLAHDHTTPRADLKASVANFTRTITIETLGGDSVPIHRRGHVMFPHTPLVDVRYAAFHHLGRTDKSVPSFEVGDIGAVEPDSNVRGRYAFHFHRTGTSDPRNPGIAVGNAVFGSPGWGFVHHDSNAILHANATYDTFGAGFVAETGNEIGAWTHNIAIRAEGNAAFNPKNGNDVDTFDMGRTGDGFWFQGRMVRTVGNVAASVNHGYVYLHRGTGMLGFPSTHFMLPEALGAGLNSAPDDAPILGFHDNEAFASTVGLYVVKANPNQEHDVHSHLSDFTAWEVQGGAALEYTSHYLLSDFDIIGKTPEPFSDPAFGIEFGTNTTDMVINRTHISGMTEGVRLGKNFTDPVPAPEVNQYVVIDATFDNVSTDFVDHDPSIDQILTAVDLSPGTFDVAINGGPPHEYLSPATSAGSGVTYAGTKTDSIGASPIPAGTDDIGTPSYDMIAWCETDGYFRTAAGDPYAVVEEYFTDRATGEIHKLGLKTLLGPEVDAALGNPFTAWRDAFERGPIDLASLPPSAADDAAAGLPATAIVVAVLANDADPDGDSLAVDGIVQPLHGQVFDNGDGTVTYRSDFDFSGTDTFRYWVTDGQGNYTPATVTVSIQAGGIFADGFEGL